ncbi:hypothetical protein [Paraburkholderia atlantica]|uniref:hypothetical protein n=1 Tax=Paraburkholderia atlantica TaxID=2654982 RepID=UPI0018563313|nr:hypothetical protein [Paraburkholderia atlantica]MBB5421013.1 hypothetical protein [Paraburkholderia atlantica]
MEKQKQDETRGMEECQLCRITYSIYSNFPSMPSAMALNAETGEWFPFDSLKSYPTGYEMAEALGYAWACNCRGRSPDTPQKKGPSSVYGATLRPKLPQPSICLDCMIRAAGQGAMTLER